MKKLSDVLVCIGFISFLWVVASWTNCVVHNVTDYKYASWNMFNIFANQLELRTEPEIIIDTDTVFAGIMNDAIPEMKTIEVSNVVVTYVTCPYTDQELEILAHVMMGEAGADWCSETMLYYVGSVVLNRRDSEYFPNSLSAVVSQEGQYQCYENGSFDNEPTDRVWEIAEELLVYGSVLPENVVYQAEFEQGSGLYCKEQNMYFCYR